MASGHPNGVTRACRSGTLQYATDRYGPEWQLRAASRQRCPVWGAATEPFLRGGLWRASGSCSTFAAPSPSLFGLSALRRRGGVSRVGFPHCDAGSEQGGDTIVAASSRASSVSALEQLKTSIGDLLVDCISCIYAKRSFTELEHLLLGLVYAVPSFVTPLLFVGKVDKGKHQFDAAV
ncbi:hypothetical protein Taro_047399 [Colocasia esculenta]|uniref:Uncharacterized protein n=1 Tax=Colocasia esculenta TaxID=4460 RepID=A0A843X0S5_COLES|nr:hypothetical protein [Colocasia esculenta]